MTPDLYKEPVNTTPATADHTTPYKECRPVFEIPSHNSGDSLSKMAVWDRKNGTDRRPNPETARGKPEQNQKLCIKLS